MSVEFKRLVAVVSLLAGLGYLSTCVWSLSTTAGSHTILPEPIRQAAIGTSDSRSNQDDYPLMLAELKYWYDLDNSINSPNDVVTYLATQMTDINMRIDSCEQTISEVAAEISSSASTRAPYDFDYHQALLSRSREAQNMKYQLMNERNQLEAKLQQWQRWTANWPDETLSNEHSQTLEPVNGNPSDH